MNKYITEMNKYVIGQTSTLLQLLFNIYMGILQCPIYVQGFLKPIAKIS